MEPIPRRIVGRLQLTSAYIDLPQGARAVDTIARVDLPFRRDFLLRVDAPFLKWSDPDRPGTTSAQGFSDLAVTAGWRAYNTPEYAVLVGVISTMPTAALPGLGTWQVYGRPDYRNSPVSPPMGFLPDRGVHATIFRRRRSCPKSRESFEVNRASQFVLGRAVVDHRTGRVAD